MSGPSGERDYWGQQWTSCGDGGAKRAKREAREQDVEVGVPSQGSLNLNANELNEKVEYSAKPPQGFGASIYLFVEAQVCVPLLCFCEKSPFCALGSWADFAEWVCHILVIVLPLHCQDCPVCG